MSSVLSAARGPDGGGGGGAGLLILKLFHSHSNEAAAEPAHFGPASGVVSGSAFLLEVQGQQHLARY